MAHAGSPASAAPPDGYDAPGGADALDHDLTVAWNQTIEKNYQSVVGSFPSPQAGRFVAPTLIRGREVPLKWLPVPRQVVACIGRTRARALCDADGHEIPAGAAQPGGLPGGREWHNEYCEYRVLRRQDKRGRRRPKRVEITTELREYWLCLAVERPEMVLGLARDVLEDKQVSFQDLYGCDPTGLSPADREKAFVEWTAGSDVTKPEDGPRKVPRGPCNRDRALFMCHPINGLDDLFFITMFGAQPLARVVGGRRLPVPLMSIFLDHPFFRDSPGDLAQLRDTFCRHADPAATAVASAAAFAGSRVALANPPGVYMSPEDFDAAALRYRSRPIDERGWIRWRRPDAGPRHQRLEVGPSDEEEAFLDEIEVWRGAEPVPLRGGFQLLELLSVGTQLVAEPPQPLVEEDYRLLEPVSTRITCGSSNSEVCRQLADWLPFLEGAMPDPPAPRWRMRQMQPRPGPEGAPQ